MLTELIARVERVEERVKSSGDQGFNDDFEEFDDLPFSEKHATSRLAKENAALNWYELFHSDF